MPYEIQVQREFCAAHAIRIGGEMEPTHGHNFRVTITVAAARLDDNDLVCDFHALEAMVDMIIAPFNNVDLNTTAPFDRVNPTAERIAEHLALTLVDTMPEGVVVRSVAVTEAPGCTAVYRPHGAT